MKGREVGDHHHQVLHHESKHNNNNNNNTMLFSNLHHHYQQQQQQQQHLPFLHPHHHQQQQQQQQHHQHHQQLSLADHHQQHHHHQQQQQQCQTSSEDNETRSGSAKKIKPDLDSETTHNSGSIGIGGGGGNGDGATIEVVRRPRGRPPGSKNKPKPPVIITREVLTNSSTTHNSESRAMRPHVLEISTGHDIIDSISCFTHKRNLGLCILTASGSVTNVSLRQPSSTPGATVTFHGRFDILSISATFLPPPSSNNTSSSSSSTSSAAISASCSSTNGGFTISLAGPQGQIFGGSVIGSLMAASTVYIVASSFSNPSYHRLPTSIEEEEEEGGGGVDVEAQPLSTSGGGGSDQESNPGGGSQQAEPCSMSMNYSCHLPSDVIWAPTPRQPPPPSHPF